MRHAQDDAIFQTLREQNVPEHVLAYLQRQRLSAGAYHATEFLYVAVMVAGLLAGMLYFWPYFDGITADLARARAEAIGGLLYETDFGVSPILVMFGWIFVAGVPILVAQMFSSRALANAFTFSTVAALKIGVTRRIARKFLQRAKSEPDPVRYIRRVEREWACSSMFIGLLFMSLGGLALARDIQTHEIHTATDYFRSPFLPWNSGNPRPWTSATKVGTGCNHVERNGKMSDDIVYEVTFPDGASTRLGDAIPLRGSWLDAVEEIHQQLTASGVPIERWAWRDRDPMHPLCIAAVEKRFTADEFSRLQRLLDLRGQQPRS